MTEEQAREVQEDDRSIKKMEDFTSPDELYQELVKSVMRYHPSTDLSMIEKAYQVAKAAHKDQVRKSGEPYIIHPLCVGIILADLELDKESIAAGLLHDVVEDTPMTTEDVAAEFGDEASTSSSLAEEISDNSVRSLYIFVSMFRRLQTCFITDFWSSVS